MQMLVNRVVSTTRWLLVAGISCMPIGSLSYFLKPVGAAPVTWLATAAPAAANDSSRTTLDLVQSKRLFGTPQNDGSADAEPAEVATKLPLELRGVFVTEAPGESVAILGRPNHHAGVYSIGDTAIDDVTLVAVLPDHVVLNNGGRKEILRFPKRTEASRQSPGVLGADAPIPVVDYSDEPALVEEDHPDRFEPGFSAVLGRVVQDSKKDTD